MVHVPGVQRLSGGNCLSVRPIGKGDIEIMGPEVGCKSTVLIWTTKGERVSYVVEIVEREPDGPDLTRLAPGKEAFIAAEQVSSAKSTDAKVVRTTVADGGVAVTAVSPGNAEVRVETKTGPIRHRFKVRAP